MEIIGGFLIFFGMFGFSTFGGEEPLKVYMAPKRRLIISQISAGFFLVGLSIIIIKVALTLGGFL